MHSYWNHSQFGLKGAVHLIGAEHLTGAGHWVASTGKTLEDQLVWFETGPYKCVSDKGSETGEDYTPNYYHTDGHRLEGTSLKLVNQIYWKNFTKTYL